MASIKRERDIDNEEEEGNDINMYVCVFFFK